MKQKEGIHNFPPSSKLNVSYPPPPSFGNHTTDLGGARAGTSPCFADRGAGFQLQDAKWGLLFPRLGVRKERKECKLVFRARIERSDDLTSAAHPRRKQQRTSDPGGGADSTFAAKKVERNYDLRVQRWMGLVKSAAKSRENRRAQKKGMDGEVVRGRGGGGRGWEELELWEC